MLKEELKYWYLRNHSLFETMSDPEIDHLCIISSFKQGEKNDIIFFSDSDRQRLYTVKEGALKICHLDPTGKEIITEILTEHDIFGCIGFSGNNGQHGNEYAKVLSDHIKICTFDMERFKDVVKDNPQLSLKYSTVINDNWYRFSSGIPTLFSKMSIPAFTIFQELWSQFRQTNRQSPRNGNVFDPSGNCRIHRFFAPVGYHSH